VGGERWVFIFTSTKRDESRLLSTEIESVQTAFFPRPSSRWSSPAAMIARLAGESRGTPAHRRPFWRTGNGDRARWCWVSMPESMLRLPDGHGHRFLAAPVLGRGRRPSSSARRCCWRRYERHGHRLCRCAGHGAPARAACSSARWWRWPMGPTRRFEPRCVNGCRIPRHRS